MAKPNKSHTCTADTFCLINRTSLRQVGDGRKLECPICGTVYDPDEKEGAVGDLADMTEKELDEYLEDYFRNVGWDI